MRKFTKSIKQYKAQIENMRTYLKELEQRKFTPQKQATVHSYLNERRETSQHSSFKKKSIKDESTEFSPMRSGSNRYSATKVYFEGNPHKNAF